MLGSGVGGGFQFGSTAIAPASSAATTTSGATSFSFGAPAVGVTQSGVAASLTATAATGSAAGVPVPSTAAAAAAAPPSRGLGGMPLSAIGVATSSGVSTPAGGGGGGGGSTRTQSVKETQLPAELLLTVQAMRAHVRHQKSECDAIARHSWTPVQRCGEDAGQLAQVRVTVAASCRQLAATVERLKQQLSWTMRAGEVAQRTAAIAAGLQYEHTAPRQLFQSLVHQFRHSLAVFRRQIEHVHQLVTAEEVAGGGGAGGGVVATMRRLHETLVWLASRLHALHERCVEARDQAIEWRRQQGPGADTEPLAHLFGGAQLALSQQQEQGGSSCLLPGEGVGPSPFGTVRAISGAGQGAEATSALATLGSSAGFLSAAAAPVLQAGSAAPLALFGAGTSSTLQLDPVPGGKRNKM